MKRTNSTPYGATGNKHIGIVTVLYNSRQVLHDFYTSLDRQTYREFTLYVVDNCSPDDSLEEARRLAKTVRFRSVFIPNTENGGVAQGNNRGIRAARTEGCAWILLANNDTVWEAEALSHLLAGCERRAATLGVPKIMIHGTDRMWSAGGTWNRWRGGTRHFGFGQREGKRFDRERLVAYAPSCAILISAAVFDRVGLMDERFFIYYDDSDFVRRALAAGESLLYIPSARISHKESVSTGGDSPLAQYHLSRNLLLFTAKHFSKVYWWYVLAVNLTIQGSWRLLTLNRAQWRAAWRGYREGMRAGAEQKPDHLPIHHEACPD